MYGTTASMQASMMPACDSAPYVAKNGYHFTILLDPENKIGETYDVSGVPETFIIDRKGQIVAHHMGAFDWSRPDVKDALQRLLDSKKG